MSHSDPVFHVLARPDITVGEVCSLAKGEPGPDTDSARAVIGFSSAFAPRPDTIVFLKSTKGCDLERLAVAAAVLVDAAVAKDLPAGVNTILTKRPQHAFAALARELFPASLGNASIFPTGDEPLNRSGALISKHALIEDGVHIEPGAIIGDHVAIGAGSRIGAQAVIAHSCQIGRDCEIGSHASVQYALIGDQVMLHPGVKVGQEGFGFVPGEAGLEKVPQLGRVIIQNRVEIGANSTIDRGALEDTVIGEGTKIDNQVQIAHNVLIGRSCAIAAQCGISGSAKVGDYCMLGGSVGLADHVVIGNRVQIAASSGVMHDIPDGEKWGGAPAQPLRAFFREQATLRRLAKPNKN